ncbi:DMT family transporter [Pseudoteredinibacter isoporae]|uniref:Drug/metabolite transporter (DMT)-like permease n=1 Tax=Pseudoteredinibacter isoporae TaxID=570281 RepID=A0A7X0JWM5_9GAMM|nr:DMT family transporter [Pseudoteredinibacter isoporae]MBB6523073.1 drug/metabolite transporter (DMT)-like permease [Pseudoteredinibacter isoporae]NHO88593.1 EamA family transporter [Pseudoteredinibacter isoporae]NIB22716.1 EamA family transporter [Pseudoteredinibacter isoporae]
MPIRLILIALLAVTSMSMVPVLVKSTSANEISIGIFRLGIALLLISPFVFYRQLLLKLNKTQWLGLFWIGLCFGVHWLTYFYSIKAAGAALAAIAVSTYGVHLLLLNVVFKQYQIRVSEWLAIAVCIGGCIIVAPPLNWQESSTPGLIVGLISGLLYGAMPLLHQRVNEIPTLTRTWGQFAFALLVFLFFVRDFEPPETMLDVNKLLALGVICTVLAHGLWVKASTELPALFTAMIYYLYVPLAMISSYFVLNEDISLEMVLGASLIISANLTLALLQWRRQRKSQA